MLTLVAVRALQLWCRCSAELARNRTGATGDEALVADRQQKEDELAAVLEVALPQEVAVAVAAAAEEERCLPCACSRPPSGRGSPIR